MEYPHSLPLLLWVGLGHSRNPTGDVAGGGYWWITLGANPSYGLERRVYKQSA